MSKSLVRISAAFLGAFTIFSLLWSSQKYATLVSKSSMLQLLMRLDAYKDTPSIDFPSDAELESTWYEVGGDNNSERVLAVHSAYFSSRESYVKLIVASDAARLIKANRWPFEHRCGYYDNQLNLIGSAPAIVYTRYFLHCPLNRTLLGRVPARISVFRNTSKLGSPEWTLPVQDNEQTVASGLKEQLDFAVCVKIFYDTPNWILLIQFLEYYRLQGAEKFFVKIRSKSITPFMKRILDYYSALDLVHVKRWDIEYGFCGKSEKWCQMNQINECVARNAHLFKFVAVCDYDELLRPHNTSLTLLDLVKSLDQPNLGAFTFTARYFVTNKTEVPWSEARKAVKSQNIHDLITKEMPWRSWRNATGFVSQHYSPKTIVKPEAVKKMWVHFARNLYAGFKSHSVDTKTEGYFMHFKNTTRWIQAHHPWKWTQYKLEPSIPKNEERLVNQLQLNMEIALNAILSDSA